MMNVLPRLVRVICFLGLFLLLSTPILLIALGIIFKAKLLWAIGAALGSPIYISVGFWEFDSDKDYSLSGRIKHLNLWVREGVFKTKPVDNAFIDIIKSNATIMSSIMATAKNAERVFTLKGLPLKIKLAAGIIYDHESHMAIYTKKGKSLVFSLSNGKLVNCNINNIFILPAVNEELEAIIGSHEDRKQVETEERDNTVDGFRDYVTAISDMLKSN